MAKSSLKNLIAIVNETKKQSPIAESFLMDLIQSIERTANKNEKKPSPHYKPSSLNCIRNMYYQIVGQDMDESIKEAVLVGIGESGTDRHERIQKAIMQMKSNGFDCEYLDVGEYVEENEIPGLIVKGKSGVETRLFNEPWNLSFLCDGIIKYKGQYYIFEFKTEVSKKFLMRKDVDEDHKKQATAYALSLGIDKVLFVYECRDNCDKKSYMLDVTDDMKKNLIQLIQDCDDYVDANVVPPKPKDIKTKTCQYCKYRLACRKDV